jgi:hypothetical protein
MSIACNEVGSAVPEAEFDIDEIQPDAGDKDGRNRD